MSQVNDNIKCDHCHRFIRYPYDAYTVFGGTGPEGLDMHDSTDMCRKCANIHYKELLKGYKCCKRSGDYLKSNAEIRAAKEANLIWIGSSGVVGKNTGRDYMYVYIDKYTLSTTIPYLEYHAKRREENRCKCWRVKNTEGNCPRCNYSEVMCLCKYDSGIF